MKRFPTSPSQVIKEGKSARSANFMAGSDTGRVHTNAISNSNEESLDDACTKNA